MTIQRKTAALLACVAAGNLLATSAQAHEAASDSLASRYQMAAVIDRARGNVVLAGNYGKAIEDLGSKGGKYFASSTNLCVAYTMTGDLEKADAECGAALRLSESRAERASFATRRAVKRDIAVALSNLGVLKAVSGDVSGAQQDFTRALEMNDDLRQASDNLQLLRENHASDA